MFVLILMLYRIINLKKISILGRVIIFLANMTTLMGADDFFNYNYRKYQYKSMKLTGLT